MAVDLKVGQDQATQKTEQDRKTDEFLFELVKIGEDRPVVEMTVVQCCCYCCCQCNVAN